MHDGTGPVPQSKAFEVKSGPEENPDAGAETTNIIDIRRGEVGISLLDELHRGLHVAPGEEKRLPTLLLYDEAGLLLFEKITYLEEYYLTNAEIGILENYSDQIAERIEPDSYVVELGSGYGPAF